MRNFNIFDPSQWSDVHGFVILMVVIAGTLFGTLMMLFDDRWKDWLDEPCGRGSIKDDWLLDRRDGTQPVHTANGIRSNGSRAPEGPGGSTQSRRAGPPRRP